MMRHPRGTMVVGLVPAVLCAALLLLGTAKSARGQVFRLPDTGQTKCYQADSPWAEIACAGTGQDGEYIINPLTYTDHGDGTVTDNSTGLMWQKEDVGDYYNWYRASGTYHATDNPESSDMCGSLNLGGFTDWRLPTKKELMSIVDYAISYPGPTIHPIFTTTGVISPNSWSSTTSAFNSDFAWIVGFSEGYVLTDYKGPVAYIRSVRCVRNGPYTSPVLTDNGNGTVTDTKTGLIWQQGEPGYMTWREALSYCEGLDLGERSDWRLPNVKELESLTDDARYSPAIDTTKFPGEHGHNWSSTTYAEHPQRAWIVNFIGASVIDYLKDGDFAVRCVRGGQSGSFGNLPDAVDDAATTAENVPVTVTVLGNDSDVDGDPLTVTEVTQGTHGSVTTDGTTVTYTPAANSSGTDSFTYTISDGQGGQDTATVTVAVSGRVRLTSAGAQDGWILESTERSGRGGTLNARATTLRLGDDREDRQYRGVLSFDTSGLPDNAVISGATLSFKRQGIVGADPFGTHGALLGDIVRGAFSGSATLQLSDFQASPSLRAAIPAFAESSDGWYSADLTEIARSFVNSRGRTQVRLRFTRDDNDDRGADYLVIYSGNAAADLRPVLEVTYTVP